LELHRISLVFSIPFSFWIGPELDPSSRTSSIYDHQVRAQTDLAYITQARERWEDIWDHLKKRARLSHYALWDKLRFAHKNIEKRGFSPVGVTDNEQTRALATLQRYAPVRDYPKALRAFLNYYTQPGNFADPSWM
jgi:hypothetical protein